MGRWAKKLLEYIKDKQVQEFTVSELINKKIQPSRQTASVNIHSLMKRGLIRATGESKGRGEVYEAIKNKAEAEELDVIINLFKSKNPEDKLTAQKLLGLICVSNKVIYDIEKCKIILNELFKAGTATHTVRLLLWILRTAKEKNFYEILQLMKEEIPLFQKVLLDSANPPDIRKDALEFIITLTDYKDIDSEFSLLLKLTEDQKFISIDGTHLLDVLVKAYGRDKLLRRIYRALNNCQDPIQERNLRSLLYYLFGTEIDEKLITPKGYYS